MFCLSSVHVTVLSPFISVLFLFLLPDSMAGEVFGFYQ